MALFGLGRKKKKKLNFAKVWEFTSPSDLSAGPVVASLDPKSNEIVVVFGTKDGKLFVIDDQSKVKWLFDLKEKLGKIESLFMDESSSCSIYTHPIIEDLNKDGSKEIIFGSESGTVFVLSADGKVVWKLKVDGKILSDFLITDINNDDFEEIIFGTTAGYIYCVDYSGQVLWRYYMESPVESSPSLLESLDGNLIVFGANDGRLIAIDKNGVFKWEFKTGDKIVCKPVIEHITNSKEKYILFGSYDKNLYCLNSKGDLFWKFRTNGRIVASPTVGDINKDGYLEIVFGSCDNKVYALDYKGNLLWDYETDFWVVSTPIITDLDDDGKPEVVVGSLDYSLYVLDSEGSFVVNYIPGVSSIAPQMNESDISQASGRSKGKLLYKYSLDGLIIGTHLFVDKDNKKYLLIGIKQGKVDNLSLNGV